MNTKIEVIIKKFSDSSNTSLQSTMKGMLSEFTEEIAQVINDQWRKIMVAKDKEIEELNVQLKRSRQASRELYNSDK